MTPLEGLAVLSIAALGSGLGLWVYRMGRDVGLRLAVRRLRDQMPVAVVQVEPVGRAPERSIVRLGEARKVTLPGGRVWVLVVPSPTRPLPAEVGAMLAEVTK